MRMVQTRQVPVPDVSYAQEVDLLLRQSIAEVADGPGRFRPFSRNDRCYAASSRPATRCPSSSFTVRLVANSRSKSRAARRNPNDLTQYILINTRLRH
jgi:hypothetical protein